MNECVCGGGGGGVQVSRDRQEFSVFMTTFGDPMLAGEGTHKSKLAICY